MQQAHREKGASRDCGFGGGCSSLHLIALLHGKSANLHHSSVLHNSRVRRCGVSQLPKRSLSERDALILKISFNSALSARKH